MVIKIDIDGVLRNILKPMCELYNDEFCTDIKPKDVNRYNVNEMFPLVKEVFGISAVEYFFERHSYSVFRCAPRYEGVTKAINKLRKLGHKIVIVSFQKSLENKIDTLNWLKSNKIYYDDICFTSNKNIVNGDVMIDDNPDFLYQITGNCQTILIDMPYNQECKDFTRFSTFVDFVNTLA